MQIASAPAISADALRALPANGDLLAVAVPDADEGLGALVEALTAADGLGAVVAALEAAVEALEAVLLDPPLQAARMSIAAVMASRDRCLRSHR
jgi:hypothetical protein